MADRSSPLSDPVDALLVEVYANLRELAQTYLDREWKANSLQPTAMVHEAYLRLRDHGDRFRDSRHFFAVAATAMRRILVDHARKRTSAKRGGDHQRITLTIVPNDDQTGPIDILALDEALLELATEHERSCRVVELRFFGGLTVEEAARHLKVAPRTIDSDWRFAKAWLRRRLDRGA